jgi:predicted amino acid-binding ACT domain protein
MADDNDNGNGGTSGVDLSVDAFVEALFDPSKLQRVERAMGNAIAYGQATASGAVTAAVSKSFDDASSVTTKIENAARGGLAWALAHLVAHLLGIDVPPDALRGIWSGGSRSVIGSAIGRTLMSGLQGDTGTLEPGTTGTERIVGMVADLTINSWFEGIIVEWLVSVAGILSPIDELSHLGQRIVGSLGLGRLVRRAVGPIVDVVAMTPLTWQLNKTYRPTSIPIADAVRQYLRGTIAADDFRERMRRAGYSEDRIDELVNGQRHFFSPSDVRVFVDALHWTGDQGRQHLRDQGYDVDTADDALRLEGIKRINENNTSIGDAAITAYADRRIDDGALASLLSSYLLNEADRNLVIELANVKRQLNTKYLTPAEAKACVKSGVLAIADYRHACELDGYVDDAVMALELQLRAELDAKATLDALRAQQAADRAAAKQAKDAAAAKRLADLEAQRALAKRGSIADLRAAVVRGLIPVARLVEVLSQDYDPDTVDLIVGLTEDDRQKYLDQQAAADDARKRAAQRNVNVAQLEQAVLDGILTMSEFAARLQQLTFTPSDATLLTQVLQAKKDALDAAAAKRQDAAVRAASKRIDLASFETLVRRGHRTMADYDDLLKQFGYDDASRAALEELLQLHINDDQQAAELRQEAQAKAAPPGVTLEQMRRAVILGVQTDDNFQTYLVNQGYDADAQAVLLAEVRADAAQAEAARARQAAADQARREPVLSLASLERAARLGLVTPDVYLNRLRADGYADDDVAIASDLVTVEIADVQDARAKRAYLEARSPANEPTLAQVEADVKAGTATLEDYRSRASALGYSTADVQALSTLLEDELTAQQDADTRAAAVEQDATSKHLSLAQLEDAVKVGNLTLSDFTSSVESLGYAADDAALLTASLAHHILATSVAGTPQ